MKFIKIVPVILSTFMLAWFLPWAYQLITDKPSRYPFTYYSSIIEDFGMRSLEGDKSKFSDSKGINYTELQFDSILPMLYYRQLASQGRLPDTLHGKPINLKTIHTYNFFFRYRPVDQFKPRIQLFPLFESMPKRVDITMPGDVFRISDNIEFINPKTNSIDFQKSKIFTDVLIKKGFQGPPKLVAGSPTTRKDYDNGYFIVDKMDVLYHLKMVNGKPFIHRLETDVDFKPQWIVTTEYPSKLFYGFLFTTDNRLFIIKTNDYEIKEVPIPQFNQEKDNLMIMGNMFHWNLQVTRENNQEVWAVDANSLNVVDKINFDSQKSEKSIYNFLIPFELAFKSRTNGYIYPILSLTGLNYLISGFLFLIVFALIFKRQNQPLNPFELIWILLTGLYGAISLILFRGR